MSMMHPKPLQSLMCKHCQRLNNGHVSVTITIRNASPSRSQSFRLGSLGPERLQLIERTNPYDHDSFYKDIPSYIALSHCSGDLPFLQLKTNYRTFTTSGIGLDSLPRTFREVVSVTKDLVVRYLWIDSFCIIQDSPEDWAYEPLTWPMFTKVLG
jgi:hypothetical protein